MGISANFLRGTGFVLSEAAFLENANPRPIAKSKNANVMTLLIWNAGVRIGCLPPTEIFQDFDFFLDLFSIVSFGNDRKKLLLLLGCASVVVLTGQDVS